MANENDEKDQLDAFRRAIARKITSESDRLVDELFNLVYDEDTDAKVKLSAIANKNNCT